MILLITPSAQSSQFARAIGSSTAEQVQTGRSIRDAVRQLQNTEFSCVVADAAYIESVPFGPDLLLKHAEAAVTLYVDLALNSVDRVARMTVAALRRAHIERLRCNQRAIQEMQDEFRAGVTGILLSSELALRTPGIPPNVDEKLRHIWDLSRKMRNQLEVEQTVNKPTRRCPETPLPKTRPATQIEIG